MLRIVTAFKTFCHIFSFIFTFVWFVRYRVYFWLVSSDGPMTPGKKVLSASKDSAPTLEEPENNLEIPRHTKGPSSSTWFFEKPEDDDDTEEREVEKLLLQD